MHPTRFVPTSPLRTICQSLLIGALAGLTAGSAHAYEGYGSTSKGGAGGDVYHVTTLADSGPGSLRDGVLNRSGPRTIVFDVGGTITLKSDLVIRKSYLTIDGSTAPAPGITIKQSSLENGSTVIAKCSDIILNNLRFYGVYTAGGTSQNVTGVFGVEGSTSRIVLDHLTIRNSSDAGPDFWGGISDITMSYCLIMYSHHPTTISHYPAPYAIRQRFSLHHNIWARNTDRNPQIRADVRDLDFVNNIIYHWGYYNGSGQGTRIRNDDGEPKVNLNIINNYWVPVSNPSWALVYGLNPGADSTEGRGTSSDPPQGTVLTNTRMGKIYTRGNILPPENRDHYSTISSPLSVPEYARVTTHSADQLKAVVLPTVGTHHRLSDEQSAIDELYERMIGEITPECTSDAQCDDGIYCNGAETCSNGSCVPGTPPCPDGTCDEAADTCGSAIANAVWMTFRLPTEVPGIGLVEDEDIVGYDPAARVWFMVFDGSDVGLSDLAIDGLARRSTGEILLSFAQPGDVPDLKEGPNGTAVESADLVLFAPASLGENTAGTFTFYFDGSDVGLTPDQHNINGIDVAGDGRLLISIAGSLSVDGGQADGKDVLAFNATRTGADTQGTFSLYFDGSQIGLDTGDEDLDGLAVTADGSLLLSTLNSFQIPAVSGGDEDLIRCLPDPADPGSFGACHLFLDLSALGIPESADVVAIGLDRPFGPRLKADFNMDGVVDAKDVERMNACQTQANVPQTDPDCAGVDQDGDLDVDQTDFGLLQCCMSDGTAPIDAHCYE